MDKSTAPLLSVVLCTYNGEKYLTYQLDSLVAQTYPHLEILVVDDCSTDRTRSILLDYQQRYDFIQLHFNEANLGFNKNFEKAILLARGEFIAICDQDDVWDSAKLAQLMAKIGEKSLVFCNSRLIDENGSALGRLLLQSSRFSSADYRFLLLNNYVAGHTLLARASFLRQTLPFPEQGYYDWWIGFVATYRNEIVYLDKDLASYRIHANSVIQKEVSSTAASSRSGISMSSYKSGRLQLQHFREFLKSQAVNTSFIDTLIALFAGKTNAIQRTYIFLFLNLHYNMLFPLHKRRGLISTTRFKIVSRYLKDIFSCKKEVLGFI